LKFEGEGNGYLNCTKISIIQLLGDKRALRIPQPYFINAYLAQETDADDD